MCTIPKITLTGCQIMCCGIFTFDAKLKASEYVLVKGIVYSPCGKPLPNAAVEVFEIDKTIDPPIEKSIGVTFTMEDGSYGISLAKSNGRDYRLVPYAAIMLEDRASNHDKDEINI